MNRQAVLVFPALNNKLAERIIEYTGGFEIVAISHHPAVVDQMLLGSALSTAGISVVLVIKGEATALQEHEARMEKMMQVDGAQEVA